MNKEYALISLGGVIIKIEIMYGSHQEQEEVGERLAKKLGGTFLYIEEEHEDS